MARTRPHEAPARVIIIDDADRLNVNAANCLLKTLEEPRGGKHIVLVHGAPDRMLPTIRSRVQRIRFRALTAEALVALIARARGLPEARADVAAALADGSAARTLRAAGAEGAEGGLGLAEARRSCGARSRRRAPAGSSTPPPRSPATRRSSGAAAASWRCWAASTATRW